MKSTLFMMPISSIVVVLSFASALMTSLSASANFITNAASSTVAADQIEEIIKSPQVAKLPLLQKIHSGLSQKLFSKVILDLKKLEPETELNDYYHYFYGQAELGRAEQFFNTKHWATATLALEHAAFHFVLVQGENPYSALQRRAGQWLAKTELQLGESLAQQGKWKKALTAFERGFQRSSQLNQLGLTPKQPVLTYAVLCERHSTMLCYTWLAKLAPTLGKSADATLAKKLAARATVSVERSPSIPYKVDLDLQAFQLGYNAYLEKNFDGAFQIWKSLLKDYPKTTIKLRTKFWMARAAQRAHQMDHAITLYKEVIRELPYSYYALLSSWFGEIDLGRMIDGEIPEATASATQLSPADAQHVHLAELLLASNVPELARMELQEVKPSSLSSMIPNQFLVYLAVLNHLAGNHGMVFQIGGELSVRGYKGLASSFGQKLIFPVPHRELADKAANTWGQDALFLHSVMKQESGFNPDAISGSNAYGLMQIIAPTARELDEGIELQELLTPNRNIYLGAKYIKQLMARFKGNAALALAAYNAGPGHAERWNRDTPKSIDATASPEEWIETITFRETREYVQNVLRNYYWYSRHEGGVLHGSLPELLKALAKRE